MINMMDRNNNFDKISRAKLFVSEAAIIVVAKAEDDPATITYGIEDII